MLFSNTVAFVFSAFLLAHNTLAALTPQQVVANINIVASVSNDANTALSQISTTTSITRVQTVARTLTDDFNTIITDLLADVNAMKVTPPFSDNAAQLVVDALKNFVAIHQLLLSTVIGKHSIFAQSGVTAPILVALRALEAQIDAFAFSMINLIPTRKSSVQIDKDALDLSVGNSITLYEQICIPSVLYPILMPTCTAIPI